MGYFPILFLLPSIAFAAVEGQVSNARPFQGETVAVRFAGQNLAPQAAFFDGQSVPFFNYKNGATAVFGIPAAKPPGKYLFEARFSNGEVFKRPIIVRAKKFPKVVLGIPKEIGLDSKELVRKLQIEKANIDSIASQRTPQTFWSGTFGLPLYDNRKITGVYGEVRITDDAEIRHLGIDFGAPLGAAVAAINGGRVAKAYYDTVYGNSVILDHGRGIYSLYLHLNEIRVKAGDLLKKGQLVGTVGKSGYATSAHLHLSVKVGNVSVDPIRFTSVFK